MRRLSLREKIVSKKLHDADFDVYAMKKIGDKGKG